MARDTHYDKFKKEKSSIFRSFRHFLEYVTLVFIYKLANIFPVAWNQKFGALFGRFAYGLSSKDRGIAEYQIDFCFPDWTGEEKKKLLKDNFRNVGTALFETLVIEKIRKKAHYWIRFQNSEVVYNCLKEGNGLVLMFGHVGNWELLSVVYEMLDIKGMTINSAIGDNKLDELLMSTRKSDNIVTVARGDKKAARAILSCFRNNEVFLFAMDQDTRVKTVFVNFFGRKAATAIGAATFAQKFRAPVVSAFGARMEDGTHKYFFQLLSRSPYQGSHDEALQLTQQYNDALEQHIRQYPSQWVWFHRRWKNQPDDESETLSYTSL